MSDAVVGKYERPLKDYEYATSNPTARYANPLLNEREKTHGDYAQVAACSQALKVTLREYGALLKPAEVNESLELICMKMARIVCGDFSHRDSWDDIIGYAELARKAACNDEKK